MRGNYLQSPIWNLTCRKEAKLDATIEQLLTTEQINQLSAEEINSSISKALTYDEYKWQLDNNMKINYPKRAEGLHIPLYKCISCGTEYMMDSKDCNLMCKKCNSVWEMSNLGVLKNDKDEITIPKWYEWQRECRVVSKEILP